MWPCPRCQEEIPDGLATCWVCGTARDGTEDPHFEAEAAPADRPVSTAVRDAPPGDLPALPPRLARRLWIEVAVVVLVVVLPDVWNSIVSLSMVVPSASLVMASASVFVRSAGVSALVLYLIWRSGDPWRCFGLSSPRRADLVIALAVAAAIWLVQRAIVLPVWAALPAAWQDSAWSSHQSVAEPHSAAGWLLVVADELVNGFAEELSMRAYLFLRLRQLLGSTTGGLLWSSLLFASYHLYQGWWGVFVTFVCGLLMGVAFLKIRRLWPMAGAHAAANIGIILSS